MENVFILGGAQTDFERNWKKEGKNYIGLLREAINDAFLDSGMTYEEIKRLNQENRVACFVGNFAAESYVNQGHLGALLTEVDSSFSGVPSARYEAACASGSVAIDAATSRIRSGDYDVAIVIGWEMMKTVSPAVGGDVLGLASLYEVEAKGIEFPFPKLFGNIAKEIIARDIEKKEKIMNTLAKISAKNYSNAKRNSLAQTRAWYMSLAKAEERGTKNNPLIGDVLATTDCSQVTDGAAVVVLANEKYKGNRKDCSKIKGWGHRVAPILLDKKLVESKDSQYILPWTKQTIDDAYSRANLSVDSIDVFETHDCFTSSEYLAYSCFGLCNPGEEIELVESGLVHFDGKKPVNPSGGLIGGGHPVGASGVRMLLDIHKQVTNKANGYQVKDAKNGLMLNLGGSATTNYSFIVGRD